MHYIPSFNVQDEESGSDTEFRSRRTSVEEKPKVVDKKQPTVPETTGEKKGVGFAEQKPKENDKGAASSEEVCHESKRYL